MEIDWCPDVGWADVEGKLAEWKVKEGRKVRGLGGF